ncbi:MAG: hypothetical protein OEY70_17005, partial [Acidimicrobiia bacterium]|nr:hypothetical protein [Acidimicrobiia bacterium]
MAKQIACGHCGGTHGSVAEVRACALAEDVGAAAAPPAAPPPPTASRQRPASTREPAPAATTHPSRTAVELAG